MPSIAPLSAEQVETHRRRGLLLQEAVFSGAELRVLRQEAEIELSEQSHRRTTDRRTGTVYRVHGSHLNRDVFGRLVRLPRLLGVARQLLDDEVYVHQFKTEVNRAFTGATWGWHQDFAFWNHEDGMPNPRAVTGAIFLDDVTEFNGPMVFVPGAHSIGLIDIRPKGVGWAQTLTNDVKYPLDGSATMRALMDTHGLIAPKGSQGSVLWFDCNTPHGSTQNISAVDRRLLVISYNSVRNALPRPSMRPAWLVGRDFAALEDYDGALDPGLAAA